MGAEERLSNLPHFKKGENPALTIKRNAYLESFLIHTRNMIDFFEDWKDSEDIRCSDFNVKKVSINLPLNNSKDEINKYLSHLTKKRIRDKSPEWNVSKIKKKLNQHFKNFIREIPNDSFPDGGAGSRKRFESLLNKTDSPASG